MAGGKKGKQPAEADDIDVDRLRELALEMLDVLGATGDEDKATTTAKAKIKWHGPSSGPGWGQPAEFGIALALATSEDYYMVRVSPVHTAEHLWGWYDDRNDMFYMGDSKVPIAGAKYERMCGLKSKKPKVSLRVANEKGQTGPCIADWLFDLERTGRRETWDDLSDDEGGDAEAKARNTNKGAAPTDTGTDVRSGSSSSEEDGDGTSEMGLDSEETQYEATAPAARQEARALKRPAGGAPGRHPAKKASPAPAAFESPQLPAASKTPQLPAASPPSAAVAAPSQAAATTGTGGQQAWWETLDGVYEKLVPLLRLVMGYAKDWEPNNGLRGRIADRLVEADLPDDSISVGAARGKLQAVVKALADELKPPPAATQAGGGGGGAGGAGGGLD